MKKCLLVLAAITASAAFIPAVAQASFVDGYITCDLAGCSSGTTHFHVVSVGSTNIYCSGDNLQLMENSNNNNAVIGWYLDDSEGAYCQQVDINNLCSINPPLYGLKMIIASYYADNAPSPGVSSCDNNQIMVFRVNEWYPLSGSSYVCSYSPSQGVLAVHGCASTWADTSLDQGNYGGHDGSTWVCKPGGTNVSGWISQWSYTLQGGQTPTNTAASALKSSMNSQCNALASIYYFTENGPFISAAEMTF
jgi:hypothetical protein